MEKTYVTMTRTASCSYDGKVEEYVNIFSRDDAIKNNWIDEDGNRIWVLPVENEAYAHTFVWEFDDIDSAVAFYEALTTKELGMKVLAN